MTDSSEGNLPEKERRTDRTILFSQIDYTIKSTMLLSQRLFGSIRLSDALNIGLLAGLLLVGGSALAHAQQQPVPEEKTVLDEQQARQGRVPGRSVRARGLRANLPKSKAVLSDLTIVDALQRNGGSRFPRSDLNVRPDNEAIPAGDVNGDGVNDWIYRYVTADDRTSDPSATTPKTFLRYGGTDFSAQYFDEFYYRALLPAGNLVGADNADAIGLLSGGRNGFEILEGTDQGYEVVATRTTALPFEAVSPADLDGDGYDDLVFHEASNDASPNEITVVFGAEAPADVSIETFTPVHDGSNSFSYTTGDVDDDGSSAEIVRLAGGDLSDPPSEPMVADVFAVDGSRELSSRQEFSIENPEGGTVPGQASFVVMELANVNGTGGKELLLRGFPETETPESFVFPFSSGSFETTPVRYQAGIRHVGDVNDDGRADFALRDTSGGEPSVAFGPSTVSDGLSPDLSIAEPSGQISLGSLNEFSDERNRLGDLDSDGREDLIVQVQTDSQFGPRLISVTPDSSVESSDQFFDNGPYNMSSVIQTVGLGDWGGDSTDDVAFVRNGFDFGANDGTGEFVGSVELYFGDPTTLIQPDVTLTHPNNVRPQMAVSGDFTGNGTPNLAITWADSSSTIEVYEAGGGDTPIHSIDYGDLADGIENFYGVFAPSIGNVGDVNDDGSDDLLVSAPESNETGSAFLFLGGAEISDQPDATVALGSTNASSIEGLGDVNGDGIGDFAVGPSGFGEAGAVRVYFGQQGSSDFSSPDVSISLQPEAGEFLGDLGSQMAAGDFNADDTTDLAALPIFHGQTSALEEGTEAIRIYQGGTGFDATPERKLLVPGPPLGVDQENKPVSVGELTALPDLNDDGSDELLYGTVSLALSPATNALVYSGNGSDAPTPSMILRAPDQRRGLGGDNNNALNSNLGSAIGDFSGDDTVEAVVPQEKATGFRDTPAYTYQPGASETGNGEEPVASDTASVDSTDFGERQDLGDTGTSITLSDSSTGSGDVSVQQFDSRPVNGGTIDASNVSNRRFVISASGDLSVGDSTEVRFDVSEIEGISDPNQVSIYTRELPGIGSFVELETTFDAENDELVAFVSGFSEFAFGSDTEPLPVEMAGFEATVDGDAVRLTWQTASETNNARFEVQRRPVESQRDGSTSWNTIGSVGGAGTTTEAQSYGFTDDELPFAADRLEYRLRQVDTDGTAHHSKTITVERGVDEVELLGTYPNPARQQATVRYALPERQEVSLRLYDVLGRQVRTVLSGEQTGRHEQTLEVSELPSGTYFLRLKTGGQTRTRKLTVLR